MFRRGDLVAGRYRIESFLDRGGMGEVYRALDLELDVPVALKTLLAANASSPQSLRRFKQEVLLARCVSHPNVCRIFDLGHHRDGARDVPFLTMEYLPGETLRSRIRKRGRYSPHAALPVVRDLCAALDAAHAVQVVHRDFKSANVMLVPSGAGERAVVTDFGLALRAEIPDGDTRAGGEALVGTPAYMSPEQAAGHALGPASDLYSLGVVLFEMTTGRLPFQGENPVELALRRLSTDPPAPHDVAPVNVEWNRAILRLLARNPAERFPSGRHVVSALGGQELVVRDARYSLPPEPDAFVGRGAVLGALGSRLEQECALVTLFGVGGSGKTRLARRYGWDSLERWPGGVWFCDLTNARDLPGIASAVAAALDVPLTAGDPTTLLGHAIAGRGRALVILDNFEQVAADAGATLGRWRERARQASFLITSRERLHLEGETVLEVDPLDPETEAVELFEARARAQRPGFEITPENRATVTAIVGLLDGLPLAIELAASRLRALSLAQLRERLADRFSVLTSPKRGRHATLRATLDWSWSLLTPWEQSALAQASVFRGGFTLEAAEAIIDLTTHADAPLVIDVIQSLVDKSWLRARVVSGAPRFSMLATVQEYAAEKSSERGESTRGLLSAVTRHAEYFAAMAADLGIEELSGRAGEATWATLCLERANLIAACSTSIGSVAQEVTCGAYLAAAALLRVQGPAGVAEDLGRRVLAALDDPMSRGRVLHALATSECISGRTREARSHLETALAIYREAGNRVEEASVRVSLGLAAVDEGRPDDARLHYEAALSIYQDTGDRRAEGAVLGNLGALHQAQGRFRESRSHFDAALAVYREVGDRRAEGTLLASLGRQDHLLGRIDSATCHLQAALEIHRENGDRTEEGIALGYLARLLHLQGQVQVARPLYEAAVAIHREVGYRILEGMTLGHLGDLLREQGQMEDAHERVTAALAIQRELGHRRGEGATLRTLGRLWLDRGQIPEARSHYAAALAIHREMRDRRSEAVSLGELSALHRTLGEPGEARSCLEESARILRELDNKLELCRVLCKRGSLELEAGDTRSATSALREAEELSEEVQMDPRSDVGRGIAELRAALFPAGTAGS